MTQHWKQISPTSPIFLYDIHTKIAADFFYFPLKPFDTSNVKMALLKDP